MRENWKSRDCGGQSEGREPKTEPKTIQRERERERMCFEKMRKNREREGSARGVPVRKKQ